MVDRKEDMCAEKGRERGLLLTLSAQETPKKKLSDPPGQKRPHILQSRRDNNTGINSQDREDENEIEDSP